MVRQDITTYLIILHKKNNSIETRARVSIQRFIDNTFRVQT